MNGERVANHIYAPTVVEITSTKAFRKPFLIKPYEDLIEGAVDACESLAAFRTFDAKAIEKCGTTVRPAAEVVLHVRPDSEAAHNLTLIEPVPFLRVAGLMAGDHSEQVGVEIDWHASSIALATGALIRYRRLAEECEFTFLFATVIRD